MKLLIFFGFIEEENYFLFDEKFHHLISRNFIESPANLKKFLEKELAQIDSIIYKEIFRLEQIIEQNNISNLKIRCNKHKIPIFWHFKNKANPILQNFINKVNFRENFIFIDNNLQLKEEVNYKFNINFMNYVNQNYKINEHENLLNIYFQRDCINSRQETETFLVDFFGNIKESLIKKENLFLSIDFETVGKYSRPKIFSTKKPNEVEERNNEDYCGVLENEKNITFALSDGAGGVGLLSSKWSKTLVQKYIEEPISADELNNWLGQFVQSFGIKNQKLISDPFTKSKFMEEGSFATLVAGQIDKINNTISAFSYGDSVLFIFDKNLSLKNMTPNISLENFEDFPYLLNWKDEINQEAVTELKNINFEIGDKLLIASDALSAFILAIYNIKNNPESLFKIIKSPIQNKLFNTVRELFSKKSHLNEIDILEKIDILDLKFEEFVYFLYESKFLMRDDYSLIFIEREN